MDISDGIPEYIPQVSRTRSDDLTQRMYMIDHTLARQEEPPSWDYDDTDVDTVIADVQWADTTPAISSIDEVAVRREAQTAPMRSRQRCHRVLRSGTW